MFPGLLIVAAIQQARFFSLNAASETMSRSKRQKRKHKHHQKANLFDQVKKPDQRPRKAILRTAQEVAGYFGVTTRTIQSWMDGGMREFCIPANSGQTDGHFPLEEIELWRQKKRTGVVGNSKESERLEKLRAETQEIEFLTKRLKYQRTIGGVLDLDDAIAASAKQAAATKSKLAELRPRLEAILPQELDDELRDRYLTDVDDLLAEINSEIGTELVQMAKESELKAKQKK